ncbi:MAG TPA: 4-hydroxythreonine-4-phosphate dehydrogenase PdxA [Arachidicoccus soli]|nr:4-hydroxythreonine-4-phosphate dehydrogenase PdxA [Arachidicoccus soli]
MSQELTKPLIGITCGDLNGIGIEIIIKSLSDNRILDICTPIIYANSKSINFYRKTVQENNFQFSILKEGFKPNLKQPNIVNCWEEEVSINPGQQDEQAGKYAFLSLETAVKDLKEHKIAGIVTAPIHKKTIQSNNFKYTGHTPYLRDSFDKKDVVMLMVAENMRVAVVTEHIPIEEVAKNITQQAILSKLEIIQESLQRDFNINKPKIAILGLNPHAGDEGLIGNEEIDIITPTIIEANKKNILAFGPYSADAFFAHAQYEKFDAVLAMYHDQGLIPFKSLALGEGVNYTAGLPIVRMSPDHGTAFDIAGKGQANHESFLAAIYKCVDVLRNRETYDFNHENPIQKRSSRVIANLEDERVIED